MRFSGFLCACVTAAPTMFNRCRERGRKKKTLKNASLSLSLWTELITEEKKARHGVYLGFIRMASQVPTFHTVPNKALQSLSQSFLITYILIIVNI